MAGHIDIDTDQDNSAAESDDDQGRLDHDDKCWI